MAFDAFLKLDGIEGESKDHKHKGEIEVLSFSWGISNPTTIGSATGGAGAGKAKFNEFSIVKHIDTASPAIFQKTCEGSHIPTGQFTLTERSTGLNFYKISFEDVFISSVQPASSPGGNSALEQLSFAFGNVQISASDGQGNTTSISCGINGNSAGQHEVPHEHQPPDRQRR
jgi:type VI secretion system secreted protein Hcp